MTIRSDLLQSIKRQEVAPKQNPQTSEANDQDFSWDVRYDVDELWENLTERQEKMTFAAFLIESHEILYCDPPSHIDSLWRI